MYPSRNRGKSIATGMVFSIMRAFRTFFLLLCISAFLVQSLTESTLFIHLVSYFPKRSLTTNLQRIHLCADI